ncbi:MAG: DUF1304 domain-containing protein [Sphingorhabdus sp.]
MAMKIFAHIAVCFVALAHFGFLVLEMFFWDHPVGREIFSLTAQQSADSAALAANQGLYNGFLAAGLLWGLIRKNHGLTLFLLACVMVAGVFGAFTAKPSIFFTQAVPGAIAFAAMLLWQRRSPRDL